MSPDPGHPTADLEPDELASLIAMYTTAVGELVEMRDSSVGGLTRELLALRADAIGTLTQLDASRASRASGRL